MTYSVPVPVLLEDSFPLVTSFLLPIIWALWLEDLLPSTLMQNNTSDL